MKKKNQIVHNVKQDIKLQKNLSTIVNYVQKRINKNFKIKYVLAFVAVQKRLCVINNDFFKGLKTWTCKL